MEDTVVVILGAGKGKRMGLDMPKVLVPVCEKPMIDYVIRSVKAAGISRAPIVVVSPDNKDQIHQSIALYEPDYAIQYEQLGTAHAVKSALEYFKDHNGSVVVLYGDCPTVTAATIKGLVELREKTNAVIAMATTIVPDFEAWRSGFLAFGRIVRDEQGILLRSVEYKDATDDEKAIREVNPCYFCFDAQWLVGIFDQIQNNNNQGEYYLTDALALAVTRGEKVETISIEPTEAVGVNTPEQRDMVESLLCKAS